MRKSVATAAVVTVAALSSTSATVAQPDMAATQAPQVKRLVLEELKSRNIGSTFVGSDTVTSARTGRVVGYEAFTSRFMPKREVVVVQTSVALQNGTITARVTIPLVGPPPNEFAGRILHGTGKFATIEGTISGREGPQRTFVTLRYTL
jgi:hypothetical protein